MNQTRNGALVIGIIAIIVLLLILAFFFGGCNSQQAGSLPTKSQPAPIQLPPQNPPQANPSAPPTGSGGSQPITAGPIIIAPYECGDTWASSEPNRNPHSGDLGRDSANVQNLQISTLPGTPNAVSWSHSGAAQLGWKIVYSKSPNPVYEPRQNDYHCDVAQNNAGATVLQPLAGPGTYYVRVCEQVAVPGFNPRTEKSDCAAYSNQITVDLQ